MKSLSPEEFKKRVDVALSGLMSGLMVGLDGVSGLSNLNVSTILSQRRNLRFHLVCCSQAVKLGK